MSRLHAPRRDRLHLGDRTAADDALAREAFAFLEETGEKGFVMGLSNMEGILEAIGHPERAFAVIHICGTNGKGSTTAYLSSILSAAGYRTAAYTSPSLHHIRERFAIDGSFFPDATLYRALLRVRDAAAEQGIPLTQFEALTAAAFVLFQEAKAEVAVVECGLGGALDATNVLQKKLLTVATNIGMDHMDYLGDTLEAIARDKAGILRPHTPLALYPADSAATRIFRERAAELDAPLYAADAGEIRLRRATPEGLSMDYRDFFDLSTNMGGLFQSKNIATVCEAVLALRDLGWPVDDRAVREGIRRAHIEGRFERLRYGDVPVLIDGGHNPQGMNALAESVASLYPNRRIHWIVGCLRDKDYASGLRAILPLSERMVTVSTEGARGLAAEALAETARALAPGSDVRAANSTEDALAMASEGAELVVICGSLTIQHTLKSSLRPMDASDA